MIKSPIEMPVSLFFHNIGPNLAQILPQRPHPLSFFLLGDSRCLGIQLININNLCCNPVVLKKMVKPLKNAFMGPICTKRGHYGPHPK